MNHEGMIQIGSADGGWIIQYGCWRAVATTEEEVLEKVALILGRQLVEAQQLIGLEEAFRREKRKYELATGDVL